MKKYKFIIVFVFMVISLLSAIKVDLRNNFRTHFLISEKNRREFYLNYKPEVKLTLLSKSNLSLDIKFIETATLWGKIGHKGTFAMKAEPYRAWVRFFTNRFTARIGLQKINFGPAQILRSLKWFDTINPLDPKEETEGVEALLLKYYFINDSNIWFWLVKNDSIATSFSAIFSKKNEIEFGGRLQYPIKYAESAITFHQKRWSQNILERKIGLDTRLDLGIGIWSEMAISNYENYNFKWKTNLTFGSDATLPVGNGIYFLAENQTYSASTEELFGNSEIQNTSALLISYPINIFNAIKLVSYYNHQNRLWMEYLSYNISFDYLNIYLNFYCEDFTNFTSTEKTFQLLLTSSF